MKRGDAESAEEEAERDSWFRIWCLVLSSPAAAGAEFATGGGGVEGGTAVRTGEEQAAELAEVVAETEF